MIGEKGKMTMKKLMVMTMMLGAAIAAQAMGSWYVSTGKSAAGMEGSFYYKTDTGNVAIWDFTTGSGGEYDLATPEMLFSSLGAGKYSVFAQCVSGDKTWTSDTLEVTYSEVIPGMPGSVSPDTHTFTGTWSENVPEPTSGLLLLIGLAGLALRRRRM